MLSVQTEAGIRVASAILQNLSDIASVEAEASKNASDVLEIIAASPEAAIALHQQGYFLRPRKVTYKILVPKDEETYLDSLGRNKRKGITKALKLCSAAGITFHIEEPVSQGTFDEWERIYDGNIKSKRIGLKRIGKERFSLMQPRSAGIFALKDGKVIGGILLTKKHFTLRGVPSDKLSISLSSSERSFFMLGVNEALNFEVIRFAIARDFRYLERGMDANLYGHYLNTGLYLFKKSLGYRITSRPKFGFAYTKILDFSKFADHLFFISIGERGIEGNLFFKENLPNLGEYEDKNLVKLNVFHVQGDRIIPYQDS